MIRMQIQLTDAQAEALRERAKRGQVSVAELVRRAIDAFTRAGGPPSRDEVRRRAMRAAGRFASGVRDTSSRHDEALAEAFRSR